MNDCTGTLSFLAFSFLAKAAFRDSALAILNRLTLGVSEEVQVLGFRFFLCLPPFCLCGHFFRDRSSKVSLLLSNLCLTLSFKDFCLGSLDNGHQVFPASECFLPSHSGRQMHRGRFFSSHCLKNLSIVSMLSGSTSRMSRNCLRASSWVSFVGGPAASPYFGFFLHLSPLGLSRL